MTFSPYSRSLGVAIVAICCGLALPLVGAAEAGASGRPCLFLRAGELASLRAKFNSPEFAAHKAIVLAEAAQLMSYNGESPDAKELDFKHRAYKLGGQKKQPVMNILPWAWALTGDASYKEMFLAVMQYDFDRLAKGELLFDAKKFGSEFTMVQFAVHGAAAYDLLYPELTPEQRVGFEKYLDQSLDLYRNRVKASYGWSNNIGGIYFASSAIVAMARLDGNPQARPILDECLAKMKEVFYKGSILPHDDGGYVEGPLYRNFALLWTLAFVDVYERVTGKTDHGLLEPPFFRNSQRYLEAMMGGNGMWITFNDSQPQWYGAPSCAWLGARYDQPLMRWMADYLVGKYNAEPVATRSRGLQPTYWVMTFLWRDLKPAPKEFPGLPTLAILPSLNTGTIRSEGTLRPGLLVGVRGRGEREDGHNQADAGSFVLYARGENFLIDPGYFQGEATWHSLPIVDGAAPEAKTKGTAPLSGAEKGDLRTLVVDSAATYGAEKGKAGPTRVRRSFAMAGDRAVVIADDIPTGEVVSQLQFGFKAELQPDGRSVLVTGKQGRLLVQAFGPEVKLEVEGPLDFGKSWIYKRMADEGQVAWHRLKATYRATAENPLVWVFQPLPLSGPATPATSTRSGNAVEVVLPGGERLDFQSATGAWITRH